MTSFRLPILLLAAALAVSGCGRKNLPVAPTETSRSVQEQADAERRRVSDVDGGFSVNPLERSLTTRNDLRISPAPVTANKGAPKRPFFLDPLLN